MIGLWLALQTIPAGAVEYAPILVAVQRQHWPELPEPWTLAGQTEQESCVSLTSRRCWNPKVELKTSREYGVGFGQITVAYRADGSVRFDTFAQLKQEHEALRDWRWEDRYDPARQLLAIVLMDQSLYRTFSGPDRIAFTLAAYNGGRLGTRQDMRLCANTPGCDPSRWFGHVELTSLKTRRVNAGYGQSAFAINRGYVAQVLTQRRAKYKSFWE